jgi:murein DD-endopeptidase MepM/ murein hydrolase activator NlpD
VAGALAFAAFVGPAAHAQTGADSAVARYEDAQIQLARIENEIQQLERQIAASEEQIVPLRAAAQRRARTAYKDTGTGVEFFTADNEPMDAARREKLLDEANARDNDAVAKLARFQAALTARRKDLDTLRAEHQAARDRFRDLVGRLERDLPGGRVPSAVPAAPGAPVCPVQGPLSFVDSWHDPRPGGRLHEGVDLMSPRGTPNVAVVSGAVTMKSGPTSGNGVTLRGDNGDEYRYYHLSAYEGGARTVAQGDVIGYTGNTGDASGGAPHTHFEIHPGGGGPVNPYPTARAIC